MVIVIIGPSGSGKDTQADFIVEKFNIPNISTGRIMRKVISEGGELSDRVNEYIAAGKWLPDELTYDLLMDRLNQSDCDNGFILNGFPRTKGQVDLLDRILKEKSEKLVAVVHFDLDEEEIIHRMSKQRKEGENRPDMTDEAIRARLKSYNDTVDPILEAYEERGELLRVDAKPSIEEIWEKLEGELDSRV